MFNPRKRLLFFVILFFWAHAYALPTVKDPFSFTFPEKKRSDSISFLGNFDGGELKITPYLPCIEGKTFARSQAFLLLNLPRHLGGLEVKTEFSYAVGNNHKNGIGSRGGTLYLVSTKNLENSRWKPFVTFSFLHSQTRGKKKETLMSIEELRRRSSVTFSGKEAFFRERYSNVWMLETCCGLQPFHNLSLIFSYNHLKPLAKGVRLNNHAAKVFDHLKVNRENRGLDLRLDYTCREGLDILVKSEYLINGRSLKDRIDEKPILIEGQLIVSF